MPPDQPRFFEPNGREPELPGQSLEDAPMLGGTRRQWPSISAYLMTHQHRAQRAGDTDRVWAIREMRYRIQQRDLDAREQTFLTGQLYRPPDDLEALEAIRQAQHDTAEEIKEMIAYGYARRAAELKQRLCVMDEVIKYWATQLDRPA